MHFTGSSSVCATISLSRPISDKEVESENFKSVKGLQAFQLDAIWLEFLIENFNRDLLIEAIKDSFKRRPDDTMCRVVVISHQRLLQPIKQ